MTTYRLIVRIEGATAANADLIGKVLDRLETLISLPIYQASSYTMIRPPMVLDEARDPTTGLPIELTNPTATSAYGFTADYNAGDFDQKGKPLFQLLTKSILVIDPNRILTDDIYVVLATIPLHNAWI